MRKFLLTSVLILLIPMMAQAETKFPVVQADEDTIQGHS